MGKTAAETAHRARRDWRKEFIACLKDTGNVTAACMVARIDRGEVYRRRERDAVFAAAWEAALEVSIDKLEHVARSRAVKGVRKPIYYKGELIDHVHEPSDRLMELLLKAHRPDKFNPVQKLEHSGGVSVSVVQFGGAQPRTIEHVAPDAGGVCFEGGTPKALGAENDEGSGAGILIENFSKQSPTENKELDDEFEED